MIIITSKKNVQRCFSKERKPRHVFMPHSGIRGGGSLLSRDVAQSGSATVDTPGMWRSPVAQRSGGPEVASSNLVIPTKGSQIPEIELVKSGENLKM